MKTHELTHANYEPWCEHCVAGRGQDAKHLRVKADSQPPDMLVVQMDYLFIAADGSLSAEGRERRRCLLRLTTVALLKLASAA